MSKATRCGWNNFAGIRKLFRHQKWRLQLTQQWNIHLYNLQLISFSVINSLFVTTVKIKGSLSQLVPNCKGHCNWGWNSYIRVWKINSKSNWVFWIMIGNYISSCTVFLSSYGKTSESLGEREMRLLFHSFFEFSQTFTSVSITGDRNTENMFSISFRKYRDAKKKINLFTLIIKMYILFARAIITPIARASSMFLYTIASRAA